MLNLRASLLYGLFLLLWAPSASAAIVFQEDSRGGSDGELSGNNEATTSLGTFLAGSHQVIGEVTAIESGFAGTADIFSFEIPTGHLLNSITMDDFSTSGGGGMFMAFDDVATFPVSAEQINDQFDIPNLSSLLGGVIVGGADIGDNILFRLATENIGVGSNFSTPLGAGFYSVYLQETSSFSRYDLSFNVTAVPEPSAFGLASLALVGCAGILRSRIKSASNSSQA